MINYYCITTEELLIPETDERHTVLYVCMIPCDTRVVQSGGSALDIASQRLDGKKKVQEYWSRQKCSRAACSSRLV